ncbi:MAG: RNA polymerase sigma-b factor, RNA polymerase sigma-32 factor [Candidatus Peregrinibacteria bacterium GW2011_GWC2_39_14]|nr:MAG: RNA polymerase sigma factor [Candidatus Peregrinibacteria bacterium GW2011_GWA2_38_36]KKR07153.1 MAG: RNA polymerase sigma-b factor, RNA polymerase sigma-32 factor [Candidatus Peregrinibacteria bacterium GW2011_GWC2_39_14]
MFYYLSMENKTSNYERSPQFERYMRDVDRCTMLTREGEQEVARRFIATERTDMRLRNQLVQANLRFVVKIAMKYRKYGFPIADIVQEGNIGLMKAVDRFDPDREIKLISYAGWWIKAEIQHFVRKNYRLMKVPTSKKERAIFRKLLTTSIDGMGADELAQLAEELDVNQKELLEGRNMMMREASLDTPIFGDNGDEMGSLGDLVSDRTQNEDSVVLRADSARIRAAIESAVCCLTPKEMRVFQERILTNDGEGNDRANKDIGADLGVSGARIQQIEVASRIKVVQNLRNKGIDVYMQA